MTTTIVMVWLNILTKYLYQYFQFFPIFIYNENFPMQCYQFFKIYKRFHKERRKTHRQQSMRKEIMEKVGLSFIKICFVKPFKWQLIIFSLFLKLIRSARFAVFYQDDARNIKRKNWEPQIARNGKLKYLSKK